MNNTGTPEYTFYYPSPQFLAKVPYRLDEIPFYPVIRAEQLAQANCPLKFLYMLREGAEFTWTPGSWNTNYKYTTPQGERQSLPYGYNTSAKIFEEVLITIFSSLHLQSRVHLVTRNPSRTSEWREWIRGLIIEKINLNSAPHILVEDIMSILSHKFYNNDLNRYIDHPEFIKYKLKIFNPHCILPTNPSMTTDERFSFRGRFPIIGTITEIDFKERIITDYFYHRDDYLAQKPDYTRNNIVADSADRRELIVYLPRITQLWLLRQALSTLDWRKKIYRYYDLYAQTGQEIEQNVSELREAIESSDSFFLRLETPQESKVLDLVSNEDRYVINDVNFDLCSLVTNGLVYFIQAKNAQLSRDTGIWSHERPCESMKDNHCNFYYPCFLKRSQIIPDSTKQGIKPWLAVLLNEITVNDAYLYKIANSLPDELNSLAQEGQLIRTEFLDYSMDQQQNRILTVQMRDLGISIHTQYFIPEWTYFLGQTIEAYSTEINGDQVVLRISSHFNENSLKFDQGQALFLFPKDPWTGSLKWQQETLFKTISYQRSLFRASQEEKTRADRNRRRQGKFRLADATYGDDTNII